MVKGKWSTPVLNPSGVEGTDAPQGQNNNFPVPRGTSIIAAQNKEGAIPITHTIAMSAMNNNFDMSRTNASWSVRRRAHGARLTEQTVLRRPIAVVRPIVPEESIQAHRQRPVLVVRPSAVGEEDALPNDAPDDENEERRVRRPAGHTTRPTNFVHPLHRS